VIDAGQDFVAAVVTVWTISGKTVAFADSALGRRQKATDKFSSQQRADRPDKRAAFCGVFPQFSAFDQPVPTLRR
jgi:tRNA U34 5-methylaminomethyl-2-thiouridine-forming methyltransferase MnmC